MLSLQHVKVAAHQYPQNPAQNECHNQNTRRFPSRVFAAGFHETGLFRITIKAFCESSVVIFFPSTVREHFHETLIDLPSEGTVVFENAPPATGMFLYIKNSRLSHCVNKL